jgi:hypothetical protein
VAGTQPTNGRKVAFAAPLPTYEATKTTDARS